MSVSPRKTATTTVVAQNTFVVPQLTIKDLLGSIPYVASVLAVGGAEKLIFVP